jgi:glycosyltransferase involved in cell wall biosynthesis
MIRSSLSAAPPRRVPRGGGPSGASDDLLIVHVTESFASGVAAAIRDFVRNYTSADHHLVYAARAEAAVSPAEFAGFNGVTQLPDGHIARVTFLRRFVANLRRPALIHAHSSKAGAYVRLAVRKSAFPVVYSPHCYAFERLDVSWELRQLFRAVEWLLSFNTTGYATCSVREADLCRWPLTQPTTVVVPNVAPVDRPVECQTARRSETGLRIAGNGRLGKQKDPIFFADAFASAARVVPNIKAVWIGDGDRRLVDQLRERGVQVTGWLPRSAALEVLTTCDVYLHTALWEGFPISILEASAAGLPVVARDRPYLQGVDMPIVIDRPEQLAEVVPDLVSAPARAVASRKTREALAVNCDALQRVALSRLYGLYEGRANATCSHQREMVEPAVDRDSKLRIRARTHHRVG